MTQTLTGALLRTAFFFALLLLTALLTKSLAATDTYEYDGAGRLKSMTREDGTTISYTLDPAGNRTNASVIDTTAPGAPSNLSGTAVSATRIDLSWTGSTDTGISGHAGYRVYRNGTQIGTSTSASYSDLTVAGSTTYSYAVAAYDNNGNISAQTPPINVATPDITPPSVPTNLQGGAPSSNEVNLSWTASEDTGGSGLAGYKIHRGGVEIGTSSTNSYTDTTAVVGSQTYEYRVAAYDNVGNTSALSLPRSITTPDTIPPTAPSNLRLGTVLTSNRVDLEWNTSQDSGGSGLAGYKIFRGGIEIGTSSNNQFSDHTVSGTTSYTYTVRAYDFALLLSVPSNSLPVTTPDTLPPSKPLGFSATPISGTRIDLSWQASNDTGGSGLAGYRIFRGGSYLGNATSNGYSDLSVSPSTTYVYSVQAYDNSNNPSEMSNQDDATTPDTLPPSVPTSLSGSPAWDGSSVSLSWGGSVDNPNGSGVAGYRVYRNGSHIANTGSTSYTDAAVATGTTYSYQVASYDNVGNTSGATGAVPITTPYFIQITDPSTGNSVSGLYTKTQQCSPWAPCTMFIKKAYGNLATVWQLLMVGTNCSTYTNTLTTPGYRRIPGTCQIEAVNTVYGQ